MQKLVKPAHLRAAVIPLLSFAGGIAAMLYPLGYKAFCTGFGGVVV